MSQIKEIKTRIKSVKDVQQITKAMKMVSASKLRKIEARYEYSKSYLKEIQIVISRILKKNSWVKGDLIKEKQDGGKALVFLSGDKGLCGGFNNNVIKKVTANLESNNSSSLKTLYGIGKKANIMIKKKYDLELDERDIFGKLNFKRSMSISTQLLKDYKEKQLKQIQLILNRFKSKNKESTQNINLLPLKTDDLLIEEETDVNYIFEPNVESMLNNLLPFYFHIRFYLYLLESEAAEFFARMTAMDAASDNANQLIKQLTLEYNRARQASITKEILDIVGGAEAIK